MHCSHAETATRTGTPENGKPPLLKLETPFFSTKASDAVNGMRLHTDGQLVEQNVFATHCVGFSCLAAYAPHVLITSSSHPGLVTGAQGCCAPVVCLCLLHPAPCHLQPVLLLTIVASGFRSQTLLCQLTMPPHLTSACPPPSPPHGVVPPQGYGSAPPPQPGDHPLWFEEVLPSQVPSKNRVYCNRALNMKQIKARPRGYVPKGP